MVDNLLECFILHRISTLFLFKSPLDSKAYRFDRIRRPRDIGFISYSVSIQIFAVSAAEFTEYVWTKGKSVKIGLRIEMYPDTCGRGLNLITFNET